MLAQSRPKVLLLIPHLGGGGAEHVIATLARHLDVEKYDLHLAIVTSQAALGSPELPSRVTVHRLRTMRVRFCLPKLLRLVWRIRPALIFVGMAHLNALVLLIAPLLPASTRIIVRQNGSVSAMLKAMGFQSVSRFLFRITYRRADRVICQTESMAQELWRELELSSDSTRVLANPSDVEGIRQCARASRQIWRGSGPNLLAIGRLSPEKGFDLLLEAFARVRTHFPDSELIIAGAGSCEADLKQRSAALSLTDRVRLLGHVEFPAVCFPEATAFVLSSRDEGLPNALLEAAAGGLPIVALPCSRGVLNLLRDKPGVWVAPEISAPSLADMLLNALAELYPFQRFPHRWIERFGLRTAIQEYELLFDDVIGCGDR